MRAREFIVEYKQYPIEEFNGVEFKMVEKYPQLIVKALDDWGNEMGHVIFNIGDNDELDPQDLEVDERYQHQGVAKTMYDYVTSHGYEIHQSPDLSPAGRGFWGKHRPGKTVWEDKQDIIVYHGNQGGIHRELITPMWWTESYEDAKYYATQGGADGWIYKAKLTCKNPYIVQQGKDEPNNLASNSKKLMQLGYDCIHDPSVGDWIPFDSKDIHLIDEPEYVDG